MFEQVARLVIVEGGAREAPGSPHPAFGTLRNQNSWIISVIIIVMITLMIIIVIMIIIRIYAKCDRAAYGLNGRA